MLLTLVLAGGSVGASYARDVFQVPGVAVSDPLLTSGQTSVRDEGAGGVWFADIQMKAIAVSVTILALLICIMILKRARMWKLIATEENPLIPISMAHDNSTSRTFITRPLIALIGALGAIVLLFDIFTPLGLASGVPWAGLILAGWWLPDRRYIFALAGVATVLVIVATLLAPSGFTLAVIFTDRVYAVAAIWIAAVILGIAKASESARQDQANLLRMLSLTVENSPAAVVITNNRGIIEYVNLKFTSLTGYERAEAIGQNPRILNSGETPIEVYEDMWATIGAGREWRGEIMNKKKDGTRYWEAAAILPILSGSGETMHYVALQDDITERKQAEQVLRHQATHDTLTGLPSLPLALDRLERAVSMARRNKVQAAVLFIDFDGFKAVNDSFGHEAGDILLRDAAARLSSCVREVDTVARIGGDEFIIILTNVISRDHVERIVQSVVRTIDRTFRLDGFSASISASVGVALYPDNGVSPPELIRRADEAMYVVKSEGKNNYGFATDPLDPQKRANTQ